MDSIKAQLGELNDSAKTKLSKLLLRYVFDPSNGSSDQPWVKIIGDALGVCTPVRRPQPSWEQTPAWIDVSVAANISVATKCCYLSLHRLRQDSAFLAEVQLYLDLIRDAAAGPAAALAKDVGSSPNMSPGVRANVRTSAVARNGSGTGAMPKAAHQPVPVPVPVPVPFSSSSLFAMSSSSAAGAGPEVVQRSQSGMTSPSAPGLYGSRTHASVDSDEESENELQAAVAASVTHSASGAGASVSGPMSVSGCGERGAGRAAVHGRSRTRVSQYPLQCRECPHVSSTSSHAKRHADVHNGRRFLCPVAGCGGSYTTKQHLVRHLMSSLHNNMDSAAAKRKADGAVSGYTIRDPATGKPSPGFEGLGPDPDAEVVPLACPVCPHVSNKSYDAKRHADMHNGLRFLCPVAGCGGSSTIKGDLVRHLKRSPHNMGIAAAKRKADGAVSGYTIRDPATGKPSPGFDRLIISGYGTASSRDSDAELMDDEDDVDDDEADDEYCGSFGWGVAQYRYDGRGSSSSAMQHAGAGSVSMSMSAAPSSSVSAGVKRPRDDVSCRALSQSTHPEEEGEGEGRPGKRTRISTTCRLHVTTGPHVAYDAHDKESQTR